MRKPAAEFGNLARLPQKAIGTLRLRNLAQKVRGQALGVLQIQMRANDGHPPLRHARTTEFFLVTRGTARARIDGRSRLLRKGDFVWLPPGVAHEFRAGKNGIEVLSVFMPALDLKKPDIVLLKSR